MKKAKRTLQRIYGEAKLCALELETALKRVVAILNSRPLANIGGHIKGMGEEANSMHPDIAEPLTPNPLLIGRMSIKLIKEKRLLKWKPQATDLSTW